MEANRETELQHPEPSRRSLPALGERLNTTETKGRHQTKLMGHLSFETEPLDTIRSAFFGDGWNQKRYNF